MTLELSVLWSLWLRRLAVGHPEGPIARFEWLSAA